MIRKTLAGQGYTFIDLYNLFLLTFFAKKRQKDALHT